MQSSYWILLIGCFFFSIGSQGYLVCSNSIEAFWFKDKETAVALAIDSSVSYLCVAGIYWTMPALYNYTNSLSWPFAVSIFISLLSALSGSILCILDKLTLPKSVEIIENQPSAEKTADEPAFSFSAIKLLGYGYLWLAISYASRIMSFNLFEFISSEYFQIRFGFTDQEAGIIISIPYLCFAVLTAPVGILIYWIGRKPLISIFL